MSPSAKSSHDESMNASLITRAIILIAFLSTFSVWSLRGLSPVGIASSGLITGVVFQDFNSNGVRDINPVAGADGAGNIGLASDRGVQGVSVTAFGPSGAVAGSGVSAADGSSSLTATGEGPSRVEF